MRSASPGLPEPLRERTFLTASVAAAPVAAAAAAVRAALRLLLTASETCSVTGIRNLPCQDVEDDAFALDCPAELDFLRPVTSSRRDMSASLTEWNVCAALSACSLISSAI